jgi:D-cysteine desulfhydrase
LLGTPPPDPPELVLDDARGRGHALAGPAERAAADLALATEGLVLDPVYTAKALVALPRLLGPRARDPLQCTVFWHTGGLLDAVADWTRHG